MMGAAGNPLEMAKCAFAMVNCVKTECNDLEEEVCIGDYELIMEDAHLGEIDNGIIDDIKQVSGCPKTPPLSAPVRY